MIQLHLCQPIIDQRTETVAQGHSTHKAAPAVVVLPRHDRVDRLRLVACRDTCGVVDVVTEPGFEPHPVHWCLGRPDSHAVERCVDKLVALAKVVLHRRLVKDVANDAVQLHAEGIVGLLVGEAARSKETDALRRVVRSACQIVEWAVILGVERACGAEPSHADGGECQDPHDQKHQSDSLSTDGA